MLRHHGIDRALTAAALLGACGGAPKPAPAEADARPVSRRSADAPDDCAPVAGKPPPKPLVRQYTGVAAKARCQREVYTIMGGLTHFLGVPCAYCHQEPDYTKMTHRKRVANWMARELIPTLQKSAGGGEIWCNDCHVVGGEGTAKILAEPRDPRWAAEWMTTHLVESFQSAGGKPLRCKTCHGANLGSPEFRRKIILTDHLPARPARSAPPAIAPPSGSAAAGEVPPAAVPPAPPPAGEADAGVTPAADGGAP